MKKLKLIWAVLTGKNVVAQNDIIREVGRAYATTGRYSEADLVSFGNYLLSNERKETISNPELRKVVGDWDISNWLVSREDK